MSTEMEVNDWLDLLVLDSIAEPSDKVAECEFFLSLAKKEINPDKFRWLTSAFFGAAYSYFEITALRSYVEFQSPEDGAYIENAEALNVLRSHVRVFQNAKRPTFVKTAGYSEITKTLYDLRKQNIHHYPQSIMVEDESPPNGFYFGSLKGKGIHALNFCIQVMSTINEVEHELKNHW